MDKDKKVEDDLKKFREGCDRCWDKCSVVEGGKKRFGKKWDTKDEYYER